MAISWSSLQTTPGVVGLPHATTRRRQRPRVGQLPAGAAPSRVQASWLGVVPAAELRRLRLPFVPRFLQDRRDLGVGDEALPALRVPVEEHPDPVFLVGIAKDGRTLRPVLLSLLGALGREDLLEAVEVLDLRRCQDHLLLLLWCRPRRPGLEPMARCVCASTGY